MLNERNIMELEARRKNNLKDAAAVRDDLLTAFGELETVVHAGRSEVIAEQERQQVRKARPSRAEYDIASLFLVSV